MKSEEVLDLFRQTGALLDGHFILRSGLRSRQYFQCALLLQYPAIATRVCEALAAQVKQLEVETLMSPAMGGILVGHEIARYLNKRHIFAEKDAGVLKVRRFDIQPGEKILVVEDVVTTGSAVKETIALAKAAGGDVRAVATIVDRSGGNKVDFGVPFYSLLKLHVETFSPDALPPDLAALPPVKPGSK